MMSSSLGLTQSDRLMNWSECSAASDSPWHASSISATGCLSFFARYFRSCWTLSWPDVLMYGLSSDSSKGSSPGCSSCSTRNATSVSLDDDGAAAFGGGGGGAAAGGATGSSRRRISSRCSRSRASCSGKILSTCGRGRTRSVLSPRASSKDGSRHRRGCDVDIPWRRVPRAERKSEKTKSVSDRFSRRRRRPFQGQPRPTGIDSVLGRSTSDWSVRSRSTAVIGCGPRWPRHRGHVGSRDVRRWAKMHVLQNVWRHFVMVCASRK
mmetsp:Transcript_17084/g.51877  ORF Transcript_17084/g.51877 Transcript_17084/m.51877 type:complete len:266 (-) Transcript_17084:290-1087(-)